jgi:hypothetical protein
MAQETGQGVSRLIAKDSDKAEYWLDHLKRCQASGQSMASYAKNQGVVLKSFYRWRKQLQPLQLESQVGQKPEFHRVKEIPEPVPKKITAVSLRFRLPNGIDCELTGLNANALAGFLATLAQL